VGLAIGVYIGPAEAFAQTPPVAPRRQHAPNTFLTIAPKHVTVLSKHIESAKGPIKGMATAGAEEPMPMVNRCVPIMASISTLQECAVRRARHGGPGTMPILRANAQGRCAARAMLVRPPQNEWRWLSEINVQQTGHQGFSGKSPVRCIW